MNLAFYGFRCYWMSYLLCKIVQVSVAAGAGPIALWYNIDCTDFWWANFYITKMRWNEMIPVLWLIIVFYYYWVLWIEFKCIDLEHSRKYIRNIDDVAIANDSTCQIKYVSYWYFEHNNIRNNLLFVVYWYSRNPNECSC